jgi:hypothetical protein
MKKLNKILFLILIIICTGLVYAQDNRLDSTHFEEAPVITEKPVYFGIGLGYVGTFIFPSYTDINKINEKFPGLPQFSGPVFLSGAHGFTGIGVIPNLRVGFFGYSGSSSVTKQNPDTSTLGSNISLSLTGISIDYGMVLFKSFAILPGLNLGWSNVTLDYYQVKSNIDWNNFTNGTLQSSYLNRAEGSFWFVQPHIDIEYALKPFLMIRGNISYGLSFSSSWKYNTNATLNNVPSGINSSGLSLQIGIFIGLFNF